MKLCLISLGCDKNLVDSEMMLGFSSNHGFTYTDDEDEAEVLIINTCCFILDAKQESIDTILEASKKKHDGCLKYLIVTGCMAQRYKQEIIDEIPEVDAVIGTTSYDHIEDILDSIINGTPQNSFEELDRLPEISDKRMISTGGWYGYLKIADGCDKRCTYCIIPSLRGGYKSYPMDRLLEEAKQMALAGVKELILVAQETTVYGKDIYGQKKLPELLNKLCEIDGIEWIRILYCYPEEITDEMIQVMSTQPKVCNYLDIPIQSASDEVLKRMGRKTTHDDLKTIVTKLRTAMPDIILRTTLISGFPGETASDHQITLDFVKEMQFNRLGVFPYSCEEGTVAAQMSDQIDEAIKQKRRDEIMTVQQSISKAFLQSLIGKTFKVIIEGKITDEQAYIGRTYMDTPGVDGYVFIDYDGELMSGDFVNVKITGSSEYDLIGECV